MPERRSTRRLAVVVALAVGLCAGLGAFTFVYAGGHAYMSDDPKVCANCHVMNEQYDGWVRSSHRSAATCNDCHLPEGFVPKLATKASNGFWHSLGFTTGRFPDPIRIKASNREVAEAACRKCHADVVHAMDTVSAGREPASCIRCHGSIGHPTLNPAAPAAAR